MGNKHNQIELVIVCTLNNRNLEKVKELIISWITGNSKDINQQAR